MTTKLLKVFKETAVPATWVADAIYFITATNANFTECYVTSSTAVPRRIPNESDINSMIAAGISSANELVIVSDITERNALLPLTTVKNVFVKNATGDSTVVSGGAYYLYDPVTSTWIKTSEAESLDVVLQWSSIQGGPTSSPTQIDGAVTNSHTHTNKTQLDKVGEDGSGNLTYNGTLPYTGWETTNW